MNFESIARYRPTAASYCAVQWRHTEASLKELKQIIPDNLKITAVGKSLSLENEDKNGCIVIPIDWWLVLLSGSDGLDDIGLNDYIIMSPRHFDNGFTETDTESITFSYEMDNEDEAVVNISGFRRGDTAIHALMHTASPEVLMEIVQEYALQGDMSLVELALKLGARKEDLDRGPDITDR